MRTADFQFNLPPELIAQTPAPRRDQSRLLVVHRKSRRLEHRLFPDITQYFTQGDLLVLNDSKVLAARLRGRNAKSGGAFELLLLQENQPNDWWVMLRPGKRGRVGARIELLTKRGELSGVEAVILGCNAHGHRRVRFTGTENIHAILVQLGETPLPPYIDRAAQQQDRERYQTVFAQAPGSIAAPTAGLHFTHELLEQIRSRGVEICFVTLHVGLGTFAPVKAEAISEHEMHDERFELGAVTVEAIDRAKRAGKRVIAAGTTTLRVLETIARKVGVQRDGNAGVPVTASAGTTRLFVYPPYRFRIVDALLTNFHLPRSTLLMLVSAFAAPGEERGRELILRAYDEAIQHGYRFFSYGDAMLLV